MSFSSSSGNSKWASHMQIGEEIYNKGKNYKTKLTVLPMIETYDFLKSPCVLFIKMEVI